MNLDLATIRPLGERILVKRYEKPEQIRGIWLSDDARIDGTLSLWEVVRATEKAEHVLGCDLAEDDIVQTRPWRGYFLNEMQPGEGARYAFIEAREVINVIKWG
jgi:co-chaperonin GroES (HSP10)